MSQLFAEDFVIYLNPESIQQSQPNIVLAKAEGDDDYKSTILIKSTQNYEEQITIEFSTRFEHHEFSPDSCIFQREFAIEHHPEDTSTHTKPHLQLRIHGSEEEKVGKIWLTLELESDEEYETCIKGFFCILESIAENCRKELGEELLDLEELDKIEDSKQFLLNKIKETLQNNGLEFESPNGQKEQIYFDGINKITSQDKSLLPLFSFEQDEKND
jgi:hypothetical protein